MSFERFNKKIKNMVGNASHPIASLKSAFLRDAAASFKKWRDEEVDSQTESITMSAGEMYPLPLDLTVKLQLHGDTCTCCSFMDVKLCTSHKSAEINSVKVIIVAECLTVIMHDHASIIVCVVYTQFVAGEPLAGVQRKEWNNPHSGSIFTSKVDGRSMYGRILHFIRVRCRVTDKVVQLATVDWFPPPQYPDGDPLLVKVDLDSPPNPHMQPFVLLRDVDPTPVMYELANNNRCIYMMRLRGLDTTGII